MNNQENGKTSVRQTEL